MPRDASSWLSNTFAGPSNLSTLASTPAVLTMQPSSALIRVRPEGEFLCYGIGVPLMTMRDPHAARSRVPVEPTA